MRLQPVIERELRVQARSRVSFWLRVGAGGAAAITLFAALFTGEHLTVLGGSSRGPWLFALLHTAISGVLAVTCPLLSADTIARERRDGTLGLLLLTPLNPGAVVMGKMCAHLVRALMIWLSVVPVLTVPFLMGGVAGTDLLFALGLELGVVLGGLAAGLLASSVSTRWGVAVALATLFAVMIGEGLAMVSFAGYAPFLFAHEKSLRWDIVWISALIGPWILGTGLMENGFSGVLARNPGWMTHALLTALGSVVLASVLVLAVAGWFAVLRVAQTGQGRELTPRQVARRRFWLRPLLGGWSRARRRARLGNDPMRWLHTSARFPAGLGRWGWCGLVTLFWCGLMPFGVLEDGDAAPLVFGPAILLLIVLALASADSFRQEAHDGSLELLVVTPVRPRAIVQARCRALWAGWLPALSLSTALAIFWMIPYGLEPGRIAIVIMIWTSFLAIALIGIRFGVRRVGPFLGWCMTLAVAGAIPWLFASLVAWSPEPHEDIAEWRFWARFELSFVLLQLLLAAVCGYQSVSDLATRRFQLKPLQRTPG